MARKSRNHPYDLPPLELECMKALWALGSGTVHEIRSRLFAKRPLAYTTVMTMMDRLARKGVVEREKRGRAHLYCPAVAEHSVRDHALQRLVDNFFLGSRDQLRQYLESNGAVGAGPAPPILPASAASQAAPAGTSEESIDPSLL